MNAAERQRAAIVALARQVGLDEPTLADRLEADENAELTLAQQLGAGTMLLAEDPEPRLRLAHDQLTRWERDGVELLHVLDDRYPPALRTVHDRPAILFMAGDPQLVAGTSGVALVGSRHPSADGVTRARRFATEVVAAGRPVISGLAAGIDAAAHRAAIEAGGRTVAVIGTGLQHAYPQANAALQAEIAADHAVVSAFWPEATAAADHFRRRNAVMSGLACATVILEASARSGTRVQARRALAHGRPVFLVGALLEQAWARELARRPAVHVVDGPGELIATLGRLADGPLSGPCE